MYNLANFECEHFPDKVRDVSTVFLQAARKIEEQLPDSELKSHILYKLLEARAFAIEAVVLEK